MGYDVTQLKDHLRFLEVIVNRNGEMGGLLPLWFDGAVCDFEELPKPDAKDAKGNLAMDKWYSQSRTLASTGQYPVTVAKPTTAHVLLLSMKKNIKHFINLNNY